MIEDLRLWNRLYCVAFDDVMREICDIERLPDAEDTDEVRAMTADFLRCFARTDREQADSGVARRLYRLMRGTLFLRFGERVLYWIDRLPEVEAEYRRRLHVLRGTPLTAEDLRPHLDRPE